MQMSGRFDLEEAKALDRADSLAAFRSEFLFPTTDGAADVYFVGNSLGLQPKSTAGDLASVLEQWHSSAVHGHFDGSPAWMDLPDEVSAAMAPLVGAHPSEVVVMNTLTVNLHLMMASFYQPTTARHKVLLEEHAFPSDYQAVASHVALRGYTAETALETVRAEEGSFLISTERVLASIEEHRDSLALILLPGVQYYTGQVFDMASIAAKARGYEIPIGLDLAHAVGNIPLDLHEWGVDFACWCTYKYLNAGPGALGGCFIHSRHAANSQLPRLAGWWGHQRETRFEMKPEFIPTLSAQGWQLSNPPILALAPILSALRLCARAGGIDRLREKSLRLTAFLRAGLEHRLGNKVQVITPNAPEQSGCQLSIQIQAGEPGKVVFDRLSKRSVHVDWREPDVIRAAPVPLYNSFEDVHRFVETLASCVGQL
ncbi:MAG: kynureninase [Aureliella sp.]